MRDHLIYANAVPDAAPCAARDVIFAIKFVLPVMIRRGKYTLTLFYSCSWEVYDDVGGNVTFILARAKRLSKFMEMEENIDNIWKWCDN